MTRAIVPSGTSKSFNNYNASRLQDVYEDLAINAIKQYGIDVYYIPRHMEHIDDIFTEDSNSSYRVAIPIEMYVKNADGFGGDGLFMKQFGYEMREQMTFTVAKRVFDQEVVPRVSHQVRPNEGDLVYFPMSQTCFQIKFTDHLAQFYQLGKLRVYDLTCELFEYSHEEFATGIPEIDRIYKKFNMRLEDYALTDEQGNPLLNEDGKLIIGEGFDTGNNAIDFDDQGDEFTQAVANTDPGPDDDVIDWSETDPFSHSGKY